MAKRVPDLGYFVRAEARLGPVAAAEPVAAEPAAAPLPREDGVAAAIPPGGIDLAFAETGAGKARTIVTALMLLFSLIAGFAVFAALHLLHFIVSWMGEMSSGEFRFTVAAGALTTICGIALTISWHMPWRRPRFVRVDADWLTISYVGFGRPMRVPRAAVRAVAVDDRPARPLRPNPRFRVAGRLPSDVFADALDGMDPSGTGTAGGPTFGRSLPDASAIVARESGTDDESPSVRRYPTPDNPDGYAIPTVDDEGWLWGNGGSALPFLRFSVTDVPNVAVLFHQPIPTPHAPLGLRMGSPIDRDIVTIGGKPTKGFVLRLREPHAARRAFDAWGVAREIHADDVLSEGLRLPKPLRGARAWIWGAMIVLPVLIDFLRKILD